MITMQVTDRWIMAIKDSGNILIQLMTYFGDRINVML